MPQDADPALKTSASQPATAASVRTRGRSSVVETAADRDKAFSKARRHTVLVRSLRWVLPLGAMLTFASYGYFMRTSIKFGWGDKQIEVKGISISREALVAHDPRYTGYDKQGGAFEVKAKTAEQDLKLKGIVRLKTIDGNMLDANRTRTDLTAVRGQLDSNTNVLELYDKIQVVSQNGMTADLTRATVYTRDSRIVSNEPVVVRMPTGTVRGQAMTIEQRKKQVEFSGGVVANLVPQPKAPASAGNQADPTLRGSQNANAAQRNDTPVDITSTKLLIDDAAKVATFTGKVVAKQNDQVLETPELEISYDGQTAGAPPPPAGATQQGRLRRLVAKHDVVLTRGLEKATGSSGDFDAINDRATLMGPVVLQAGADRGATADRADIDNKLDTILLTGNVVVTQQRNLLKGRRLFADRKQGTVQMTAPAMASLPKGQISAKLYQGDPDKPQPKRPAAALQPEAAKSGPLGASMRADPNQPIDVDADQLDVDDKKKTAIFRGRVKAVQGDYTISTEELVATYAGETGMALAATPAAPATQQSGPATPKPSAQLQSLVSPRRAVITAKDGQRAEGDQVSFDPKANTAKFTGNVVLSQGKMVTAGQCAIMDMASGSMKLLDACGFATTGPQAKATPLSPSTIAPASPGRAQALFYPNQMKDDSREKGKSDAAKSAPATTAPAQSPGAATAVRPSSSGSSPANRVSPVGDIFGN